MTGGLERIRQRLAWVIPEDAPQAARDVERLLTIAEAAREVSITGGAVPAWQALNEALAAMDA